MCLYDNANAFQRNVFKCLFIGLEMAKARKRTHQRPRIDMLARAAKQAGNFREADCYGHYEYCPAAVRLHGICDIITRVNQYGQPLEDSVIAHEERAVVMDSLLAQSLGIAEAKRRMQEIEGVVIESCIAAIRQNKKLTYSEKLERAKPYLVGKLVSIGYNPRKAQGLVNLAIVNQREREELQEERDGGVNFRGIKADESYTAAFQATQQTLPLVHPRGGVKPHELYDYAMTRHDLDN